MQNIELILTGIGTILTIITGFVLNFQKNKSERLKQKEDAEIESAKIINKLSDIDTLQNAKIDTLVIALENHIEKEEAQTKIINEMHNLLKHKPYFSELSASLIERVIILTKDSNKGIQTLLFKSIESILPLLANILDSDFKDVNEDIIYLKIKSYAENSFYNCRREKFNLEEIQFEELISDLPQKLKQPIKAFARDVYNLSVNVEIGTNGRRRDEFTRLCTSLTDKAIEITNDVYLSVKK